MIIRDIRFYMNHLAEELDRTRRSARNVIEAQLYLPIFKN